MRCLRPLYRFGDAQSHSCRTAAQFEFPVGRAAAGALSTTVGVPVAVRQSAVPCGTAGDDDAATTWSSAMKTRCKLAVVAVGVLSAMLFASEASAQATRPPEARNVVLVHGAWAD